VYGLYFSAYEVAKLKVAACMPDEWKQSSLVQARTARARARPTCAERGAPRAPLGRRPRAPNACTQLLAGFLAECCAASLWNPWEVVRQRLQVASGGARTFSGAALDVVTESGVRGLYSGLGAYMALWGLYSPLMFMFYEQGLNALASRHYSIHGAPPPPPSIATNFVVGAFAGGIAAVITSPLDVVKTRIQCQAPGSITQYESVVHGLRDIARQEGNRALFHGTLARSLNMGLSTGIMLTCYSTMRNSMGIRLGWIEPPRVPQEAPNKKLQPRQSSALHQHVMF